MFKNSLNPTTRRQYIGRRDKNGVEVFEGDVLSDGAIVEYFETLTYDNGCQHPGFYCRKWFEYGEDGKLSYHDNFEDIEVVGNVCDNPELVR